MENGSQLKTEKLWNRIASSSLLLVAVLLVLAAASPLEKISQLPVASTIGTNDDLVVNVWLGGTNYVTKRGKVSLLPFTNPPAYFVPDAVDGGLMLNTNLNGQLLVPVLRLGKPGYGLTGSFLDDVSMSLSGGTFGVQEGGYVVANQVTANGFIDAALVQHAIVVAANDQSLTSLTIGSGLSLSWIGDSGTLTATGGGGGGGSVSNVALTMPAEFSVAGSPITGSGTLAVSKANQRTNTVYAGPTVAPNAAPTFRGLVAADLPLTNGALITLTTNGDGSLSIGVTGSNTVALSITTNDWTLNQYYTNGVLPALVSGHFDVHNGGLVYLYLDQAGSGTWTQVGKVIGNNANTDVYIQLGAALQPGARFVFTNVGGLPATSVVGSAQWVTISGTGAASGATISGLVSTNDARPLTLTGPVNVGSLTTTNGLFSPGTTDLNLGVGSTAYWKIDSSGDLIQLGSAGNYMSARRIQLPAGALGGTIGHLSFGPGGIDLWANVHSLTF